MAQFSTWLKSDLKKPLKKEMLDGTFFAADSSANLIGVEVTDNGSAANLSGTVTGYIVRDDGGTVAVSGTLSSNKASIVLPLSAYTVEGPVDISIKLTSSGEITTLASCRGYIHRTTTETLIDPGTGITLVGSVNGVGPDNNGNVTLTAANITSGTFGSARIPGMVGATASAAGTKGAVPAPSAGDQAKLLTGAGTWISTSGAASGSTAPASAGALYTLQQTVNANQDGRPYVTPEDFGAADTRVLSVDDASYISQAIASGKPVMLKRAYMVRSEITVTQAFTMGSLFGLPWTNIGFTFTNGGKFTINAEYATFNNLYFYGYNEGGEGQYSTTAITVNGANGLDGDAEFNECVFSGLSVAIRANARGLWIKNSLFARCDHAVELNFVGTTTDTDAGTSKKYGGRNFLFQGNRFHTGVSYSVYIISGSSAYGLLYESNVSDHGGAGIRVDGELRCSAIVGNSFNLAGTGMCVLYTASGSLLEDVVIANNTASSVTGTASTTISYRDIMLYGEDINRLHITGNAFDGCGYESILFAPASTPNIRNVTINSNSFANISQISNNVSYGAIGLPNVCSNVTIVGNSFSNIPSNVNCIRCNLSSTPSISNLVIMLNTYDGSGAGLMHPSLAASNSIMNVLPIANGGTGATTAAGIRNTLGLGNTTGALPIANGGTGQTTAAAARNAFGLKLTYLTTAVNSSISAQSQLYVYANLPSGAKPIGCWFEVSSGSAVLIVSSPVVSTNNQVLARIYNPSTSAITATGTMYFLFIASGTIESA